MSKALTITKQQAVAIAKKELATLRNKRKQSVAKTSHKPEPRQRRSTPVRDRDTATHLFYCSDKAGEVSAMTLKLTKTTATTGKVAPLPEQARESFETGDDDLVFLKRDLVISHDYAGCPHCHQRSMVRCGICGALSCHESAKGVHTCPQCGREAMTRIGAVTLEIARQQARESRAEPMKALPRKSKGTALVIRKK